ncbi:transposable element Tcb1 transposase [Trichonephila clavipes]|nr:transposable element Tcb1 transposase [Trichonephila clavipes]
MDIFALIAVFQGHDRIFGNKKADFLVKSSIAYGIVSTGPPHGKPSTLRLNWAPEDRAWEDDRYQVVFSDELRFDLWYHDGRIRVRQYAIGLCIPECAIERHSGLTPGVMVWDANSYHGQSNLLRIEGNLNSSRYVREVLQLEVIPFLQCIPGAIFQQHNSRPHVTKTVLDFCSVQLMHLLPWLAYSPDMPPIEHVWALIVGVSLVIGVLKLQKTNFFFAYKQYGISFPQANIQNLFESTPRRLAAFISVHGVHTNY